MRKTVLLLIVFTKTIYCMSQNGELMTVKHSDDKSYQGYYTGQTGTKGDCRRICNSSTYLRYTDWSLPGKKTITRLYSSYGSFHNTGSYAISDFKYEAFTTDQTFSGRKLLRRNIHSKYKCLCVRELDSNNPFLIAEKRCDEISDELSEYNVNEDVVNFYQKELDNVENRIDALNKKIDELKKGEFEKQTDFENRKRKLRHTPELEKLKKLKYKFKVKIRKENEKKSYRDDNKIKIEKLKKDLKYWKKVKEKKVLSKGLDSISSYDSEKEMFSVVLNNKSYIIKVPIFYAEKFKHNYKNHMIYETYSKEKYAKGEYQYYKLFTSSSTKIKEEDLTYIDYKGYKIYFEKSPKLKYTSFEEARLYCESISNSNGGKWGIPFSELIKEINTESDILKSSNLTYVWSTGQNSPLKYNIADNKLYSKYIDDDASVFCVAIKLNLKGNVVGVEEEKKRKVLEDKTIDVSKVKVRNGKDCVYIDGKKYKTKKIKGQVWLLKNLLLDVGKGCKCDTDNYAQCFKNGRLYNYEAAMRAANKIEGWRLPTREEWDILLESTGGEGKKRSAKYFLDPQKFNGIAGNGYWSSSQYRNNVDKRWIIAMWSESSKMLQCYVSENKKFMYLRLIKE